jgi:site-specific DNA-methyltransferase (adenine-specific)
MVLDPFAGAATTLMVAAREGRHSIGIELSETYAEMARERLREDKLSNVEVQ